VEDIRELSDILESTHPDPYINGGGKVAYHRRLQQLIRGIPDAGLTRQDLLAAVQPFVAGLKDGHTTLSSVASERASSNPGGIPLYFEVVETSLYVSAVTRAEHLPLIGAVLESVEGVPLTELARREAEQRGHDNYLHVLSGLARDGALYFREPLHRLVPEWQGGDEIRVGLRHPSGDHQIVVLRPAQNVEYPLLQKASRIELPEPDRPFAYHFLDGRKELAFLRIDNMTTYRELFEYSRSIGDAEIERWARRVYERWHGESPPEHPDAVIAGIPSASETFQTLFREMKAAGSRALIVDLRRNFGGNDLMVQIFLYFLVGVDRSISVMGETAAIQKLSPLFDASTTEGVDLDAIRYGDRVPLKLGDYDFSRDARFMSAADLEGSLRASYLRIAEHAPTFFELLRSGEDDACYFPERIFVLSGNATQSSGFDLLTQLYRLGAEVVGVASSQAGNHFGNIRSFQLSRSKLTGWVSSKYFVAYPNEPATGFTLEPQYPLTYEKLASYGFDKNATLLVALELLPKGE
jgi:hypothetical protein